MKSKTMIQMMKFSQDLREEINVVIVVVEAAIGVVS
jgi:hypothetical protein